MPKRYAIRPISRARNFGAAFLALGGLAITWGGCDGKGEGPPPLEDVVETSDAAGEVTEAPDVEAPVDATPDVPEDTGPPPECGPGSTSPLPDPCNDYDACTTDLCVGGRCVREAVVDCCNTDDQCDDGIACTEDRCNRIRHLCESVRGDSFCCVTTDDCDDLDTCTENVCAANRCVYPVRPSCPVGNPASCNDQNDCTTEQWSSDGTCAYTPVTASGSSCCTQDVDCDDTDPDTVDLCQAARCWNGPGACTADSDCAGPGYCSTGSCVDNSCVYPDSSTCCETDAVCDDGLSETSDRCVENRCVTAIVERRCTADTECPVANACVVATCVSGYCSATPSEAEGCCRGVADCAAPERCADVVCEQFACAATPTTEPRAIWSDDFSSLARWSVASDGSGAFWQTRGVQFISAPSSLYFGTPSGGFDVGHTYGRIFSDRITLPTNVPSEALSVSLWRNLLVEAISSRDLVSLEILDTDDVPIEVWNKSYDNGPGLSWRLDTVPVPAGLTGTIRFRFRFDTIDAVDNVGQGAYIDDIKLLAPCP